MNSIFLRRLALALTGLVSTALGEARFSFDATPGQLPKDIVPASYAVRIEPDLEHATLRGSERIAIDVRQPVRAIVLNAAGLAITRAVLAGKPDVELAAALDEKKQTLTLTPPAALPPGAYELRLEFTGTLTEQPQGLFITRYATPAGERRALMTQFEATDARRMFPCWDEPVFRARFQLTAVVPEKDLAISNMPAEHERKLDGGMKEIAFASSPPMASYLLAFCAGEFEVIEDAVDGLPLRVITAAGKREQARYALEATKKIVPFYNDYFGVKFPLPKLDQICFASTGAGGMENWGCITYNDTAFLYDPASSSQQTKERVFGVVAHEIAHQWFGDLVTMAWWDNLWLNEGFASWMGTKATDHFNSDWHHWLRAAGAKEEAMRLDARATTHPIQQRVENEAQAEDAFDEITYLKGQSFIRMLESWLGEEKFRDGIRRYMKRHAFANTTTADLWAALGESSGKDVAGMAAGWTEQPGFPLVKIEKLETDRFRVSQERFTVHQRDAKPLIWQIPVDFGVPGTREEPRLVDGQPVGGRITSVLAMRLIETVSQETAYPIPCVAPFDTKKLNLGDKGYYRVAYDAELFATLMARMSILADEDRLNLLNDTWALVTAERLPVASYLDLANKFRDVTSAPILEQIVGTFGQIDFLARGREERARFRAWARDFLRPQLARLGWTSQIEKWSPPFISPLDDMLRANIVRELGDFGDEDVLREARARFAKFLAEPASLTGDLRGAVVKLAGRTADDATYEKLHELAKRETSTEQKRLLYNALAGSLNPRHAEKTLALAITDELIPTAATRLVNTVATDGEQTAAAWKFAEPNLAVLHAKLSALGTNGYVAGLFSAFTEDARADELETFAKAKLPPEAQYEVSKAADEIRFHAELKARVLPEIDAWCRAKLAP